MSSKEAANDEAYDDPWYKQGLKMFDPFPVGDDTSQDEDTVVQQPGRSTRRKVTIPRTRSSSRLRAKRPGSAAPTDGETEDSFHTPSTSRPITPSLPEGEDDGGSMEKAMQVLLALTDTLAADIASLKPEKKDEYTKVRMLLRKKIDQDQKLKVNKKLDAQKLIEESVLQAQASVLEVLREDYLKIPVRFKFVPCPNTVAGMRNRPYQLAYIPKELAKISRDLLPEMGKELRDILEAICQSPGTILEMDAQNFLLGMYQTPVKDTIREVLKEHATFTDAINDLAMSHTSEKTITERKIAYTDAKLDWSKVRKGLMDLKDEIAYTEPGMSQKEIVKAAINSALHKLPSKIKPDLFQWLQMEKARTKDNVSYNSFARAVDRLLDKHNLKKKLEDTKDSKKEEKKQAKKVYQAEKKEEKKKEKEKTKDSKELSDLKKMVSQLATLVADQTQQAQITNKALMQRPLADYPQPPPPLQPSKAPMENRRREGGTSNRLVARTDPRWEQAVRFASANNNSFEELYEKAVNSMEKRGKGRHVLKRVHDPDQPVLYTRSQDGKKYSPSDRKSTRLNSSHSSVSRMPSSA